MTTIYRKTYVYSVRKVFKDNDETLKQDKIIDLNGRILYRCCTLVIGSIVTDSEDNLSIPFEWNKIKLKIPRHDINCLFSLDDIDDIDYKFCMLYDIPFITDIFETKVVEYNISIKGSELNMVLYMNPFTIESKTSLRERRVIRSLMSQVYQIEDQSIDDEEVLSAYDINLHELFDKVIQTRGATLAPPSSADEIRCLQLRIQLRKHLYVYQEKAIVWMVKRELAWNKNSKDPLQAPSLYHPVALNDSVTVFYNPYRNHLKMQPEAIYALSSGGLLCDEMGLGKTVEVLGCILLHKRHMRAHKTASTKNARCILSSSDSSSSDDTDNADEDVPLAVRLNALRLRPVIKRPPRVRIPQHKVEDLPEPVASTSSRPSRIPDEFVSKRNKPLSGTRKLLQHWYEEKLSGFNESARQARNGERRSSGDSGGISCACGISTETGNTLVQCSECGVRQHAACFGYKVAKQRATQYLCPGCWKRQPLLKSGATLIVCPSRLLSQWQDEIRKHVRGGLRVFIYKGGSRSYPVYPSELQLYDIVLTTYQVLQKDLHLADNAGKSLRQKARYCPPAASIANVNWWRLVLDEAQLVESPTLSVAKMAKLLSAKHRWAITGTPITTGLEELLGIFDYLSMKPYNNRDVWYFKLMRPYLLDDEAPMLNFLAEVMWRTEKRHVQDQINIPKQSVEITWLDFNQIESYFYFREYEASKSLFIQKLNALNMPEHTPIRNLAMREVSNILAPVLTLRRACSHFSAAKGRYLVSKKPLNSLQDLLDALLRKNNVDFEDNLRIAVSAWNGMAGIQLLSNNHAQAIHQYKRVLRLKETLHEQAINMKVEMDNLQVIHAVYNLISILVEHSELREDTDDIDKLKRDHLRYEKLYITKFDVEVLKAKKELDEAKKEIYDLPVEIWDFYENVDWLMEQGKYDKLMKMMESHPSMTEERGFDRLNIGHHVALKSKLDSWTNNLAKSRNVSVTAVVELATYNNQTGDQDIQIDNKTVEAAVECHLRNSSQQAVASGFRRKCILCHADNLLNDYESLLYNKQWKPSIARAGVKSHGNWAPTLEEIALQCIGRLSLQQNNEQVKRNRRAQTQLLDGMRRELKAARTLWMKISNSLNSRDEVNNCRVRLELNPNNDNVDVPHKNNIVRNLIYETDDRLERINLLKRHEIDYQYAHLSNEAETAVKGYEKLLGTNLYLGTLRGKDAIAGGAGRALDPCPICRTDLGDTFHMMPCGHCYCINCMQILAQQEVRNTVVCAVCRLRHGIKDINYLKIAMDSESNKLDKDSPEASETSPIKGNCSTKMAAAIRLVMRLRNDQPHVKVLIYSIWNVVLGILYEALQENGVTAVHMTTDRHLDQFKDPTNQITALLLRISDGSKGLTLIEATHVLFLDPVLDPRDELQAISRVHRIGQTRATVVHRFLMKDSIDESIFNVTNKNAEQSIGWKEITIAQLKELYTRTSDI